MYVDGVLQTNTVSEIVGIGISTNGMDDGPAPLGFGTYLTVTGNGIESCVSSQNINGQLDDFRIYDRVITSQEATQLLNESNVPCDPAVVTSVDIAETCEGYSTITVLLHVFAEEVSMEYFNGTNWVPDSGVWLESDGIVHHVYQTGQYRCKAVMECGEISYSNDIVISSFPIVPSITIFGNTSVCSGSNLNLTSTYSGPGTPTYQWSTGATDFNATDNPTQSTIYSLTITSPQGCSATDDHEVTVLDLPEPVITESGGVLTASGGPFQSHQWYLEGNSLGVVVGTYTPTQAGNYTVSVTQGPCTGTSPVFNYNGIPTGIQNLEANGLNVYPNPFANEFVIETTNPTQIRVINALGETILSRTINGRTSIDATSLATGIYFVQEETSGAVMKLVKH
jgi:hypothetical protein